MKQSRILALSAALLISTATAKPFAHQHLHKRDIVTVTVTEDFIETIDVIIQVYAGTPIATLVSTEPAHAMIAEITRDVSHLKDLAIPVDHNQAPTTTPTTSPQQSQQYGGQQWAQNWQQKQQDDQKEKEQEQEDKKKQQDAQIEKQKQAEQQQAQQNHQTSSPPSQQQQQQQQQQQPPQSSQQTQTQPSNPPQQQSGGKSGGSGPSGGSCGAVGGKCMASDVTIYNAQGAGACGWSNDTNSEDFFALAQGTFGPYTNDAPGPHKNAFCGRMATISVSGKQISGMLTDSCPGCTGWSLDLSQSLWNKVYDGEAGTRKHDVEWWFTSSEIFHGASG